MFSYMLCRRDGRERGENGMVRGWRGVMEYTNGTLERNVVKTIRGRSRFAFRA